MRPRLCSSSSGAGRRRPPLFRRRRRRRGGRYITANEFIALIFLRPSSDSYSPCNFQVCRQRRSQPARQPNSSAVFFRGNARVYYRVKRHGILSNPPPLTEIKVHPMDFSASSSSLIAINPEHLLMVYPPCLYYIGKQNGFLLERKGEPK